MKYSGVAVWARDTRRQLIATEKMDVQFEYRSESVLARTGQFSIGPPLELVQIRGCALLAGPAGGLIAQGLLDLIDSLNNGFFCR